MEFTAFSTGAGWEEENVLHYTKEKCTHTKKFKQIIYTQSSLQICSGIISTLRHIVVILKLNSHNVQYKMTMYCTFPT